MSGDDQARFDRLAISAGPRVLAYLARRADPPQDAADIYQEVLVTTWRRMRSVPSDDQEALAWMIGVARRALANHRRGILRRHAATNRLRDVLIDAVQPAEVDEAVLSAMAALRADDRELLTLVYWDGLTTKQAAAVVKVSSSTARKRLQRARDQLRVLLEQDGDVDDDEPIWSTKGSRGPVAAQPRAIAR